MRTAVFLLTFLFVLATGACSKNRRIIKRIEGTWKLEQFLHNDGSYTYPVETHIFAKGEHGGKSYAAWTKYTVTDTVNGTYNVTKKGDQLIFRNDNVMPVQADTFTIDDMDKESLIIRNSGGILFFKKQ